MWQSEMGGDVLFSSLAWLLAEVMKFDRMNVDPRT